MKKNILLGLMLLSAVPIFSANVESGGVPAARPGGMRGFIMSCVPGQRYLGNQALYATAGGGAAYTAAHYSGACSDGWLGWIGLGGLCGGLYLGNRHYRSAEHETGVLTGARDAAQQLAAGRQATIEERNTAIGELNRANGVLQGERDAANAEVDRVHQRNQALTAQVGDLSAVTEQGFETLGATLGAQGSENLRALAAVQYGNIRGHRAALGMQIAAWQGAQDNAALLEAQDTVAALNIGLTQLGNVTRALDVVEGRRLALDGAGSLLAE